MIIVGTSLASSERAVEIAHELPGCYAAVGIHPHHVSEFMRLGYEHVKKELTRLIREKKVVAVGETGIDYHRYKNYPPITEEQKQEQKELFYLQLELAKVHHMPVIFHCREAQIVMLDLLKNWLREREGLRGVFHCFEGTQEQLEKVLQLGFLVGFDGNITYAQNEKLRQLVAKAPLNRLVIETDAPYLTPEPKRGERNEPSCLPLVASALARIKTDSLESILVWTTKNALALFALDSR